MHPDMISALSATHRADLLNEAANQRLAQEARTTRPKYHWHLRSPIARRPAPPVGDAAALCP